jgi:outer membrane receptor protein involved in Fe transport
MQRKLFAVLFAAVLLPALVLAQDGKLRGRITDRDSGEPLVGANVFVEATNLGAACDINGDYVILSVRPGVYTLRVSYVGYNQFTISNVRVSSNLTTTQDFKLTSSAIQVQAVEIVAERPLVQRNTTNTVRLQTQEDIENLPIRGIQNIMALQAGVVQQGGNLYVRGGRAGEIAYFVDGANVTNPLSNSEMISIIQEAVEELQLQSGGYTAEWGGSSSGIIRTNVRTGGPSYKASVDYLTDDFAKPGQQFLGTSSFGYRNVVATLSGPIPGVNNLTFFLAGQHNYQRNRRTMWLTPFEFDLKTDANYWQGAGQDLPGPIGFKENYLPNNWVFTNSGQGTFQYDIQPLKFRFTGSYAFQKNPTRGDWRGALANVFTQARSFEEERTNLFGNLRMTHVINASTYYELGASFTSRTYKQVDPTFGTNWGLFVDSAANAAAGFTNFKSRWVGPLPYYVIFGFAINNEFTPNNSWQINTQQSWGFSGDLTRQMDKNWELKVGARADMWTMRQFIVNNITNRQVFLYGTNGNIVRTFASEDERRVALGKTANGNVNNYGYDVDGNLVDDGLDAPRKPVFLSGYLQNKFEYRDLILSLGLRYEYFDPAHKTFADPLNPDYDPDLDVIDENTQKEVKPYQLVLPRISVSFPVTDATVFYAQYGNYAQMPSLSQIYVGNTSLSRTVSPITRGNAYLTPIGYLVRPERTTQYEIGIRQVLSGNFAFTLSGFYKDIKDQIQVRNVLDANGTSLYTAYLNDDFGTVKGIELTLELRRTNRFAAKFNYTLSDARGTSSNSQTQWGALEQNIGRATSYINPLDFNQTHRGTFLLDYRWGLDEGGPILSGLGGNILASFNSGHPYTKIEEMKSLGQADAWGVGTEPQNDNRFSYPMEPVNTSTTPFVFNIDVQISKMFKLGPLGMEVYVNVLNLLNTKHVLDVYPTTGSAQDDGMMTNPLTAGYRALPDYEAFYRAINLENRWSAFNDIGDFYGSPRQIRVGMRVDI